MLISSLCSLAYANAGEISIPSGSSFPAIVTAGVSFNKSLNRNSEYNPEPLALKITDGKLKDCLVIASAIADWSANRAQVKLTKLSCGDKEFDAQGWLAGADNKAGIANMSTSNKLMDINAGANITVVLSKATVINESSDHQKVEH